MNNERSVQMEGMRQGMLRLAQGQQSHLPNGLLVLTRIKNERSEKCKN